MDDRPDGDHEAVGGAGGRGGPWRTFALAVAAVVLVGAGVLVPREGRVDDPGRFEATDLEHRLATLDGARTTEVELLRYADALDGVAARCPQGREEVAEQAADVRAAVVERGASAATTRRVLSRVADAVDDGGADCGEAFAEAQRRTTRCQPHGDRPCGY